MIVPQKITKNTKFAENAICQKIVKLIFLKNSKGFVKLNRCTWKSNKRFLKLKIKKIIIVTLSSRNE